MAKERAWRCTVCGYVHRGDGPADPCPVCAAPASAFEEIEAPEPVQPAAKGEERVWRCTVCGYIHRGESPVDPCPICGAPADAFEEIEEAPKPAPLRTGSFRCLICGHVHRGHSVPDECPVCAADASHFEPFAEEEGAAAAAGVGLRVLVVGAGIAGLSAAESVRQAAPDAEVLLFSKETRLPYYRLNLTRYLAGEVEDESLPMHPESWYEEQGIRLLPGAEVTAVHPAEHEVELADGSRERYDKLVLANGAHPFVPPIPGAQREGVTVFRTVEDARRILNAALGGARCVCIGGGILGLEAAGALARRGATVTLLEGFDWLMPRQLNRRAGDLLERLVTSRTGIRLLAGVRIEALAGDERVREVVLKEGDRVPADFVVITAGVRPNSHLARRAGLECKHGVVVDDHLRTSEPDIFAAGDVAEHRGELYGIWPASQYQGSIAGLNAAGSATEFGGIPRSNTLKVLGIDVVSIGCFAPDDGSYDVVEEEEEARYRRFVFRDNTLRGAVFVGEAAVAARAREAIEAGTDFSKLLEGKPTPAEVVENLGG